MMDSQHSQSDDVDLQDLLLEATEWSEEEFRENLPLVLPAVISFLQKSPQADDCLQVVKFVLGSFLPHLEINAETFKLLKSAFPLLRNFFSTFLEKCILDDEKNIELIHQSLQHCTLVVECCLLAVQSLGEAGPLSVGNIDEFSKSVFQILNDSLQHCAKSKDIYKDDVELISKSVGELCNLSIDLSSKLANLVAKFSFDTFSDEDLEVLVYICEQFCITARCLSELSDLRSYVAVWRVYVNLVNQHHSALITSLDTAVPLDVLVKEIRNGFEMLVELPYDDVKLVDKTSKMMQRTLKTVNFCLKIVVSFCEKFRGYLHGAHRTIASLLVTLFRFSPGNVELQNFPDKLKKEIESQTTIGIEPLLVHLRNDEDFVKVTLDSSQEILDGKTEDCGSYLLLLVAVAIPPTATVLLHVKQLISSVFSFMQKSHLSLSVPCMMDGVMCGGRQQTKVSLYEHILTQICVLVANLDGEQFNGIEKLLIKWLLSGHTWPAMLAADIWCFVARYGTSELCWNHCEVLLEVLVNTEKHSHQCLVTASLLGRLVLKLAPKDREMFISLLLKKRDTENSSVSVLFSILQKEKSDDLKKLNSMFLSNCTTNINAILSRKATDKNVFSLKQDLDSLHQVSLKTATDEYHISETNVDKEFANYLGKLWKRLPENLIGASAFEQLLRSLANASILVLKHFSNADLYQILSFCHKCVSQGGTSVVCLSISSLIGALGRTSINSLPEKDNILNLIAECLSLLLKSSNPVVHQSALDAFVLFGKHTVHGMVLSKCLAKCDHNLQEKVKNYLKQEPQSAPEGHSRVSFLKQQINVFESLNISSSYISIKEKLREDPSFGNTSNQDSRISKRKRLDEDGTSTAKEVKSFIRNLLDCQNTLSNLKKSDAFESDDRNRIKKCLQEMLNSLDDKL